MIADADRMPAALRAKILQGSVAHLSETAADRAVASIAPPPSKVGDPAQASAFWNRQNAGWFAAAACLVLAVAGWMRPSRHPVEPTTAQVNVSVPPAVVKEPVTPKPRSAEEERDAMLAQPGTIKVALSPTKDPAGHGVTADVVWDPATQTGFLHVVGLKANDPRILQYQAWIFDGARDQRYPVDCAIFDVPRDKSEVTIPIQAAIPVSLAKAFAVTVEKPGGVVVPDRIHVVVLGAAG
jgi:hypothetical protein